MEPTREDGKRTGQLYSVMVNTVAWEALDNYIKRQITAHAPNTGPIADLNKENYNRGYAAAFDGMATHILNRMAEYHRSLGADPDHPVEENDES